MAEEKGLLDIHAHLKGPWRCMGEKVTFHLVPGRRKWMKVNEENEMMMTPNHKIWVCGKSRVRVWEFSHEAIKIT